MSGHCQPMSLDYHVYIFVSEIRVCFQNQDVKTSPVCQAVLCNKFYFSFFLIRPAVIDKKHPIEDKMLE